MRHHTMRRKGRYAFALLVISARCVVLQAQYVPNKRGLLKIVFPTRILSLGAPYFKSFFQISRRFYFFFKMSKKRSNYESSVFLRIYVGEKRPFLVFGYFWQKYWSEVDQISPSFSHQYYLQILFNEFFSNSKNYF